MIALLGAKASVQGSTENGVTWIASDLFHLPYFTATRWARLRNRFRLGMDDLRRQISQLEKTMVTSFDQFAGPAQMLPGAMSS